MPSGFHTNPFHAPVERPRKPGPEDGLGRSLALSQRWAQALGLCVAVCASALLLAEATLAWMLYVESGGLGPRVAATAVLAGAGAAIATWGLWQIAELSSALEDAQAKPDEIHVLGVLRRYVRVSRFLASGLIPTLSCHVLAFGALLFR